MMFSGEATADEYTGNSLPTVIRAAHFLIRLNWTHSINSCGPYKVLVSGVSDLNFYLRWWVRI